MIRPALTSDLTTLLALSREMYQESGLKNLAFDEGKVWIELFEKLNSDAFTMVYEKDGQIIGMIGAMICKHIFSNDLMSMDYLVYVKPEHRGSAVFASMIQEYIDWSKSQGVKPANIYIGVNAGVSTELTVKCYERLGFVRSGINLRYGGN